VKLANDVIYREENRDQYHSGVELFVAAKEESECSWTVIGAPKVYLNRENLDLTPLDVGSELSLQFSNGQRSMAPLPQSLLGVTTTSNFAVHTLRLQANDRFVLMSRTLVPPKFLLHTKGKSNLAEISRTLAEHSADMPFWLAILEFN